MLPRFTLVPRWFGVPYTGGEEDYVKATYNNYRTYFWTDSDLASLAAIKSLGLLLEHLNTDQYREYYFDGQFRVTLKDKTDRWIAPLNTYAVKDSREGTCFCAYPRPTDSGSYLPRFDAALFMKLYCEADGKIVGRRRLGY